MRTRTWTGARAARKARGETVSGRIRPDTARFDAAALDARFGLARRGPLRGESPVRDAEIIRGRLRLQHDTGLQDAHGRRAARIRRHRHAEHCGVRCDGGLALRTTFPPDRPSPTVTLFPRCDFAARERSVRRAASMAATIGFFRFVVRQARPACDADLSRTRHRGYAHCARDRRAARATARSAVALIERRGRIDPPRLASSIRWPVRRAPAESFVAGRRGWRRRTTTNACIRA